MPLLLAAAWQPAEGPLKTRWAKDVSPENAHPEYPRPQMVRKEWLNLNGLWDLAITAKDATRATFQTQILVPFPVESALSGVMRPVSENERIWYRRTFEVPAQMAGPARAAAFRRGGFRGDGLGQRPGSRPAPRAATTPSASTSPTRSSHPARTS